MMKKLTLLLLLLTVTLAGCRPGPGDRYQRYLETAADSTFEYLQHPVDTVLEDAGEADAGWADDDGLIAVPDIPRERRVNMRADDYELERLMRGRGE